MEGMIRQSEQVSFLEPCKSPSSAQVVHFAEDGPLEGQPPAGISRGSSAEHADEQGNCNGQYELVLEAFVEAKSFTKRC